MMMSRTMSGSTRCRSSSLLRSRQHTVRSRLCRSHLAAITRAEERASADERERMAPHADTVSERGPGRTSSSPTNRPLQLSGLTERDFCGCGCGAVEGPDGRRGLAVVALGALGQRNGAVRRARRDSLAVPGHGSD